MTGAQMRPTSAALAALVLLAMAPMAGAEDVDLAGLVLACEPCHGMDGIAKDSEVPHLAGQNQLYLLNQLRAFHAGTRKHKEMRVMTRRMTDAEIEALAEYFAGLPRQ
jgi:cytochrome c553